MLAVDIDQFITQQAELLQESVVVLDLPQRTVNCLEGIGIFTVRDLLHTPAKRLLEVDNFGKKTLDSVYEALAEKGFVREWGLAVERGKKKHKTKRTKK